MIYIVRIFWELGKVTWAKFTWVQAVYSHKGKAPSPVFNTVYSHGLIQAWKHFGITKVRKSNVTWNKPTLSYYTYRGQESLF